jgi:hypothetical protein
MKYHVYNLICSDELLVMKLFLFYTAGGTSVILGLVRVFYKKGRQEENPFLD